MPSKVAGLSLAALFAILPAVADATGTALVQQRDGSVKTYDGVRLVVANKSLSITSADGKGTIVIDRAACTAVDAMIRCIPYAARLEQFGQTANITLQSGTVWLNPTDAAKQLPLSSTQLPPHGILLAVRTAAGTFVTLSGVLDEMKK